MEHSLTTRVARLACVVWLGASSSAIAQQTWIVDRQNRPGTNFTDLTAAITAAAEGDRIEVRWAGDGTQHSYWFFGVTINKSLVIYGEPRSERPRLVSGPIPNVITIPAGGRFILDHIGLDGDLKVQDSAGTVVLSRIEPRGPGAPIIVNSPAVFFVDCVMAGGTGIAPATVSRSRVFFERTSIYGSVNAITQSSFEVHDSEVSFVDCYVRGADGSRPTCEFPASSYGTTSIRANRSVVHAMRTTFEGGWTAPPCEASRSSAVIGTGFHFDPTVQLIPPTPPPTAVFREQTWVTSDPHSRSGPTTVTGIGPVGTTVALHGGLLTGQGPLALSIGDLWLHPGCELFLGVATVGASRSLSATFTIPSMIPLASPILYQSVSLASSGLLELSPPSVGIAR